MKQLACNPGEVAQIRRLGSGIEKHEIVQLVKSSNIRSRQVIIPAGEEIPTHEAEGEVILHCLQGHVCLDALSRNYELTEDELLCLEINEPFSTKALENSSLLIIVVVPKQGDSVDLIGE